MIFRSALDHADDYIKPYLRFWDITGEEEIPNWSSVGWNLITCFETMEHIPEEYVGLVLSRMYGMLDPGGSVLLAICTSDRPGWDSDPTHVTIYPREWWIDQLLRFPWEMDERRYERARTFHLFGEHNGTFILRKPLLDTEV